MSNSQQEEKLKIPSLPLAVYREIAAHLRQIEGLEVEIIPQSSQEFSYLKSQVEGLVLRYPPSLSAEERQYSQDILQFYEARYGTWERKVNV